MEETLTVEEQLTARWKLLTIISACVAVLFFVIFLLIDDPLWKGIFRLVAFIGFTGTVLGWLRLRDGKKTIHIEILENQLLIHYLKENNVVKEEVFERKTIKNVYKKELSRFKKILNLGNGYEFYITFTDTKTKLGLFEYSGRNMRFSKEIATNIDQFINNNI